MLREDARRDINGRSLTDFVGLKVSRKAGHNMYICPICGSGSGKNGTGAFHIYPDSKRVFCYSQNCFTEKGEDTLGALKLIWKCDETEALERAGYVIDKASAGPSHQEHKEHQEYKKPEPKDNTSFYREAHEALKKSKEALAYLHDRGITDASIDKFYLGYCEAWKHSKSGDKVPTTKRIIIPRTKGTYTARRIDKPQNDIEKQYVKQIEGRQGDLFNLKSLEGAEACFICEGELDAISLYQAGAESVIGIGSITNINKVAEEARKNPKAVYILALDNDKDKEDGSNPGRKAQRNLEELLKKGGLEVLAFDPARIYGESKDANEALRKDPERLQRVVAVLKDKAQELKQRKEEAQEEDLKKRTGEGMLEDFLLTVAKRDFEPIPTGIKDIDKATQGGFIRKTLVMLGAAPGMGKTALAQWIFENMASVGEDVLYLNLEMSREQLLARSISRLAWKYDRLDINALDVLRGYSWTEEQRATITKAARTYQKEIAPHFIYNPEGLDNSIDSILKAMQDETARLKALGKQAPLVCIDYLQLVDSKERDAIEGMKGVIFKLKDFAKQNNTVVFLITANNRASNKQGTAELESGRDTSTIEYSGDLMLGISYTAIEDKRKYQVGEDKNGNPRYEVYDLEAIRKLKKEAYENGRPIPSVCNELSVKVLKNRFGDSERRANLIFDGKHSSFMQKEIAYSQDTWQSSEGEDVPFN